MSLSLRLFNNLRIAASLKSARQKSLTHAQMIRFKKKQITAVLKKTGKTLVDLAATVPKDAWSASIKSARQRRRGRVHTLTNSTTPKACVRTATSPSTTVSARTARGRRSSPRSSRKKRRLQSKIRQIMTS